MNLNKISSINKHATYIEISNKMEDMSTLKWHKAQYIYLTDELNEKFNDIWHSLGNQRKFLYATRIYDRNN